MLDDKLTSTLCILRDKYMASLDTRQAELAQVILALCDEGFSPEGLSELFYMVHSIVGVAPTYGLPHLGELAAQAELILTEFKDRSDINADDEEELIVAMERLVMEMGRICEAKAA